MSEGSPRFGVVVSTVGRPVGVDKLLRSLSIQDLEPSEVVVVDQSREDEVVAVVDAWRDRLPVRRVTSGPGLSVGRNVGFRMLGEVDYVTFPDDDCWYEPDVLARAAVALSENPGNGVTGTLESGLGHRLRFGSQKVVLDRVSVWTNAIEATMFLRKADLDALGGFDEQLGIGAQSPWQSGEGTDLLLRLLRADGIVTFVPDLVIHEDGSPLEVRERRMKARRYARGTGRVIRRHYGLWFRVRSLMRPILAGFASVATFQVSDAATRLATLIGRFEGLIGRTLP